MSKKKNKGFSASNASIQFDRSHLLSENSSFYTMEAYKSLRTNVTFALADAEDSKVVLVTSSAQGEGKSTTSANLAISFAMAGKSTVLVDCDLRRPKIARLMDIQGDVGLSNVLMNPKLCGSAIKHSSEQFLDIMGSGDVPPNPSELLGSVRMHQLIEALKMKYEYIILDTPPINVVTDAVVLSPETDGALMVVRSGISERRALTRAVSQLEYANAKLLGFVLTDVYEKTASYGKKYGYGYGYGYGYSAAAEANKKDD